MGVSDPRELTVRRGCGLGPLGRMHFCSTSLWSGAQLEPEARPWGLPRLVVSARAMSEPALPSLFQRSPCHRNPEP